MNRRKLSPRQLAELQQALNPSAGSSAGAQKSPDSFKEFSAQELYCQKCKRAMPVREKLLLSLPGRDLFDYLCTGCGSSLGTKTN